VLAGGWFSFECEPVAADVADVRRGRRQVDVVVALGVSAQTALRWHRAWVEGDRETLVGAGRAGRMR
jgi:hypothetical protein